LVTNDTHLLDVERGMKEEFVAMLGPATLLLHAANVNPKITNTNILFIFFISRLPPSTVLSL
jgi:hypothetical protein